MYGVRFPTTEKKNLPFRHHVQSDSWGSSIFFSNGYRSLFPGKTTGPRTWPLIPSNVELRIHTAILCSRMRPPGVALAWRQVLPSLDLDFIPSNCKFLLFVLMDFKVQKHCHLVHVCMVSPYCMLSTSYRWDVLNSKPCLRSYFR